MRGSRVRLTISATGVFASGHIAGDPAIATPVRDKGEHFRGESISFRTLACLAAEFLSPRFCRGETGFDALTDEVTFEFSNARQEGRKHPNYGLGFSNCHLKLALTAGHSDAIIE
jgi:hypothetical protein